MQGTIRSEGFYVKRTQDVPNLNSGSPGWGLKPGYLWLALFGLALMFGGGVRTLGARSARANNGNRTVSEETAHAETDAGGSQQAG
jgi:hypothetical protein